MNRKTLVAVDRRGAGRRNPGGRDGLLNGKAQQATQAADPNRPGLVQMYSPTQGNPEAKVHIVEFLDPACETCASFYP